jgi:hypothetical protein
MICRVSFPSFEEVFKEFSFHIAVSWSYLFMRLCRISFSSLKEGIEDGRLDYCCL